MKSTNAMGARSRQQRAASGPGHRAIVRLTIAVWPEDGKWLSECVELGVGTFGESAQEAGDQAIDAVASYLNTLEDLRERERVFAERGIEVVTEPITEWHPRLEGDAARRPEMTLRPFDYQVATS